MDWSDPWSRRRTLQAAVATAAVIAGCSSGDGGGDSTPEPTPTPTPTETSEPTPTETSEPTPTETSESTATPTAAQEADTTIAVGPDGSLRFDPERVGVSVGDTVEWVFESGGHNVGGRPSDSSKASIPDGAEPFSSYPEGDKFATDESGTSYYHTFETKGDYSYVCIPHASSGMVGEITVR